jgi:hypothetical protein
MREYQDNFLTFVIFIATPKWTGNRFQNLI